MRVSAPVRTASKWRALKQRTFVTNISKPEETPPIWQVATIVAGPDFTCSYGMKKSGGHYSCRIECQGGHRGGYGSCPNAVERCRTEPRCRGVSLVTVKDKGGGRELLVGHLKGDYDFTYRRESPQDAHRCMSMHFKARSGKGTSSSTAQARAPSSPSRSTEVLINPNR